MNRSRSEFNIQRFNAARDERNVQLIRIALSKFKKQALKATSIGRLAKHVSSLTGIHRTTLTRNRQYGLLLYDCFLTQRGIVASVADNEATEVVLRAKLIAARLESANLRQRIRHLEAIAIREEINPNLCAGSSGGSTNRDYYVAFVNTAVALTAVLRRLRETVTIDLSKRAIVDLAAPPTKQTIVGSDRVSEYVAWLKENDRSPFTMLDSE
jgi:hypothetical protein